MRAQINELVPYILEHNKIVAANGGIYLWKDGRKNFDTMTAVFDYGPLDDLIVGCLPASARPGQVAEEGLVQLPHDADREAHLAGRLVGEVQIFRVG